jgi:hypothetical protein
MALGTANIIDRQVPGDKYLVMALFKPGAADYASPGYPVTAAMFGFTDNLIWVAPMQNTLGYLVVYDPTNVTLRVYRQTSATSALVEVPNSTDLSALVIGALAMGR